MSPLCSWCGAKVPDDLRFSPEQIKKIEEEEESVRKARDAKDEEIAKKKKKKAFIGNILDAAAIFLSTPPMRPPDDKT